MKKLFLLASTALVFSSANAQEAQPLSISGGSMKESVQTYEIGNHRPHAKSSISGGRWYNHAAMVDEFLTSGLMDFRIFPIWFDSTISQVFTTGLGTINYSSVGQVVDPISFSLWNDVNVSNPNDIAIEPESPYQIDSISFFGFYVEDVDRPLDIVDTMIFSVSTSGNDVETPHYIRNPSSTNWTNNSYTCSACPDSTLIGYRISPADSINRISGVNGVVTWKVPLDTAFRRPDSANIVFGREYTYPVMVGGMPGVVNIPPGRTAAVTITFKSGDSHTFMDSIDRYHRMYIHTGEGMGPGTPMPYFYYSHKDHNMSNLMFASDPSFYAASIIVEGHNAISFFREFHNISTHILCADCPTVAEYSSIHSVNGTVATDMSAYPNPANSEIDVSFSMNQNTNAKVYITNAVGQIIDIQEVSNVVAKKVNLVTFSTAKLSAGIYFYTVEAKGQRATNRFVVSH